MNKVELRAHIEKNTLPFHKEWLQIPQNNIDQSLGASPELRRVRQLMLPAPWLRMSDILIRFQ